MTLSVGSLVAEAFERRVAPLEDLAGQAEALTLAAQEIAERFAAGGRLLVFGAATDAQHVAVEFLHPVIVGKPALPAISLVADIATLTQLGHEAPQDVFARQLGVLGRPQDIALGISRDAGTEDVRRGLAAAAARGMLTVGLLGDDVGVQARHALVVRSDDPLVVKEGHVSTYHLLWELVHVFLEDRRAGRSDDPALALYPFLAGGGSDDVVASTVASSRAKLGDVVALRAAVGAAEHDRLVACAAAMADRFQDGGTLLAFGNGGSSTDTQDVVQAFLAPVRQPALPALCLTNDVAVVTALSNDVSFEVIFARQLAALARPGDVALGISTSGGSANVLAGLSAAADLGLLTVGLAGNEGGAMRALPGLEHLFVVPSSSVHRIQEVQTTLYHVLWEAVQAQLASSAPATAS
jgi:D-sedoheptulose 7-phosphate isomerase